MGIRSAVGPLSFCTLVLHSFALWVLLMLSLMLAASCWLLAAAAGCGPCVLQAFSRMRLLLTEPVCCGAASKQLLGWRLWHPSWTTRPCLPSAMVRHTTKLVASLWQAFARTHSPEAHTASHLKQEAKGFKRQAFPACFRQRSYHAEYTGSRPIAAVKPRWAALVLSWVTRWEYAVLLASTSFCSLSSCACFFCFFFLLLSF